MQSATGDFRTLPAGTYTIYGAPYSQADPATFIGKTLAEIATSACVIPSTTFITMTVTGVPAHDISIGSFTGGSVSASSPSSADGADVPVGETVTLTISTDTGYKLTGIEAHKTNEANTPVTLSGSGDGNGATRTFEMPAYGVTVTATFGYTDDQQALLDAKQAIEGVTSYTVVQANAHDEASLKMALATVLNTLLTDNTINYTVAAADITIAASPVYAVAGTAGNTNGTNGSFSFTVSLHKSGTTTATTASKSGIITATPYDATQDNTDIGAAKTTVENATYTTTQAEVQNITQAKAKVEGIIGTLTLNGVTATVADGTFDAAIAGTATNANGTDGSYTFTVTLTKGAGTSQTTINLTLLITATAYDPTPDIDAAKTLVEATNYEDTQVNIPDLAAARARVTAVISTLNLNGVTPTVADGTFTGATAGTDGSPNGTNGSYTFTVQLEKAGVQQTTNLLTLLITATPYTPPSTHLVNISPTTNGTVIASPVNPVTENTTVTLTITPDAGYELETISTTPPLTLDGTGNSRTFTMPTQDVTVNATFKKTADQLAVEAAQVAIEGMNNPTVAQATANTEAAVKTWLAGQINTLLTGYTVTADDITLSNPVYATAGTTTNQSGMNGSFSFTVSLQKGNSKTLATASRNGTITATPYDATQDNTDIAAVKVLIENASYTDTQANIPAIAEAKAAVETIIFNLSLNGVTPTVVDGTFTGATAGTAGSPNGTNGSYTFTVKLNKGGGAEQTTAQLTLTITATPYTAPDTYLVNIITPTNGTVTASPAGAVTETTGITLTITPSAGYELDEIKAYKTGDDATTVALLGAGATRTFDMPAFSVTVEATFTKTADQLDVEAAKTAIEGMANTTVAQATANSEATVKAWLAQQINALAGMNVTGITVAASDITLSGFSAAVAGTVGNLPGTNGSFSFSVSLKKNGSATLTTASKAGIITATPYDPAQDNADITAAQSAIENASYTDTQVNIPTQAAARAKVESIIGGLNLNGVTTTLLEGAFTAATAGTAADTDGTDGSYTFTVRLNKGGGTEQITAQLTLAITATPYDASQDNADIATAKTQVENATYTDTQANIPAIAEAKAAVEAILSGLSLNGVVTTVVDGVFTAAIAGTDITPNGTDGSYTFYVKLNKGGGAEQTTIELTLAITATPYAAAGTYQVNVGLTTNGTVTASPANPVSENATVTLTITPAEGYELDNLSTMPPLTLDGTGNTRTFDMPAQDVTVNATFTKTADQLAVETAQTLIEGLTNATVDQATANTEATVKAWLAQQINALAGMNATGITVAAADITLSGFAAAAEGTAGNPPGTNGSFSFTVSLKKNSSATLTTSSRNGVIIATPYSAIAYTVSIGTMANGTVTAQPASATAGTNITLTISPAAGYELEAISTTPALTLNGSGNTRTFTMPANDLTVNATFRTTSDQSLVEAAKAAIEGMGNVSVHQATANSEATVKAWLAQQINALQGVSATGIIVTVADITLGGFTAAVAGDDGNPSGTDGSFTFTVSLQKGASATVTTAGRNGEIIATAYSAPLYAVTIGTITNGTVSAYPSRAIAGETVRLTLSPAEGYELDTIRTTPSLTLSGSGNSRTFAMPASAVTVTATFKKTQAQQDKEAVQAAKIAIEGGLYRIAQATGNTATSIKTWLLSTFNVMFGQLHNTQFRSTGTPIVGDVTIGNITPALSGTEASPSGTNGEFEFTVTLTRGATTLTTFTTTGVIVATPHSTVPMKRIELIPLNELTVRILNTGNLATGNLTLALSGANADVFTLPAATTVSLSIGDETEVALSVRDNLPAGTYKATLTVSGEGMTPVTLEISYSNNATGIDGQQANTFRAWVRSGLLYVTGLTPGKPWSIYGISGTLIYQGKAESVDAKIGLPARGIYVVTSGNSVLKVVY